jgi:acyl-CoA thioesterase
MPSTWKTATVAAPCCAKWPGKEKPFIENKLPDFPWPKNDPMTNDSVKMTKKELAAKVVDKMYFNDPFSLWLGIERVEDDAGRSVLKMTVRQEMLNGFGIAHGGISYALADSALAFASNSHGRQAVSIETAISHTEKVVEGDVLTAIAEEENLSHKIGNYRVVVKNQAGKVVALFKGIVYRTSRDWEI